MKTIRRMMQLALALTLAVLLTGVVNVGSAAAVVREERAEVTVVVVPRTTSAAATEGFLTYEIIAINRGSDWARNTTITVPFAPATLKRSRPNSNCGRAALRPWPTGQPA
jgi:hypothetical protein